MDQKDRIGRDALVAILFALIVCGAAALWNYVDNSVQAALREGDWNITTVQALRLIASHYVKANVGTVVAVLVLAAGAVKALEMLVRPARQTR